MIDESHYTDMEKQALTRLLDNAYALGLNPADTLVIARNLFRGMGLADPHPLAWLWMRDDFRARVDQPAMTFDRQPRS